MNKILAVDVDLTVVDTVTPWKQWYTKLTGHDLGEISSENNDLENMMKRHADPLVFWKDPKLYDELPPIPEAVEYLGKLNELGIDIIFVSACFPEHEQSKRMFVDRSFPYNKGFISTADKSYVRCDYFVDDYKKYCKQMGELAIVFHIKTELNSPSEEFPYVTWKEIYEMIKDMEK
jgi:5'(3')-deoxyribonucleotidase